MTVMTIPRRAVPPSECPHRSRSNDRVAGDSIPRAARRPPLDHDLLSRSATVADGSVRCSEPVPDGRPSRAYGRPKMAKRRRTAPQPITSVRIETPAPATSSEPEGDVRRPWRWQKEAIDTLKTSPRRMLTAPTGSGKSMVVQSLGLNDLADGMKVIVAVPQLSIGGGYERETIELDGELREWDPAVRVHTADVRTIVRFLLEPPGNSESERALVCTHVALVLAAQHPDVIAATDPWRNVSLFLDEAHHVLTFDGDADGTQDDDAVENALGAIVRHYLREAPAPLTLITATWMRTDDGPIVPRSELNSFARYHRTFDAHMKDMRHVRTLEIRFVVGQPTECLKALFTEHHPSKVKTVVWHPAPGSELLQEQGGKYEALESFRRVTGWRRRRVGPWDRHELEGTAFSALELIDDGEHRDASMTALLAGIDAQKEAARRRQDVATVMARTPDVVWALNMLREGSDYPALARGILMAPRGSMLDTLQMLGRLLRDFPGKERVELDIILPIGGSTATPTAEQVSRYLKFMMASLLVEWQFRGFGLDREQATEADRGELAALERADVQQQLASDLVEAAIRHGDIGQPAEEEAERIAEDVVTRGRIATGLSPGANEIVKHRLRQMLRGHAVATTAGAGAFDVEETLVGRLRSFVGRFGYADLRKLREGLGRPSHVTLEQVRVAMRAFHARYGRWPRHIDAVEVPGIDGTWASLEHALRKGLRGLPGGSSLAMQRDGVTPRARLTSKAIADAVIAHRREHARWPGPSTRGRIPSLGYGWAAVDRSLKKGRVDGVLAGQSLADLVRQCQGRARPLRLTIAIVQDAIREYHAKNGAWPRTTTLGDVPIIGGTWQYLNKLLGRGLRGLPTAEPPGRPLSLARVVAQLRGVPASSTPLTIQMVQASVLAWRCETGEWPSRRTDGVARDIGVRWCSLDGILRSGRRSLPGGLNLTKVAKLLEKEKPRRGARKATSSPAP